MGIYALVEETQVVTVPGLLFIVGTLQMSKEGIRVGLVRDVPRSRGILSGKLDF